MILYAVNQYHLDTKIGETVYFLKEDEMKKYLKMKNEEQVDVYRGFSFDPLLSIGKNGQRQKESFKSFAEFLGWIKSEYSFIAMDLYSTIKRIDHSG